MALFDWIRQRASNHAGAVVDWRVWVEEDVLNVENDRREPFARTAFAQARSVRVVPLGRGSHHSAASGWQVAFARPDGDVLVGPPLPEWQSARDLARKVCQATSLPMDALTEKLFSRVGKIEL